ncbi:MAG TPA: class I adenylate-forming enzyme family protein [Streptosporangiaceae bacterium]|nr:class I adenylate-forming enzyme family protein [Streptosporangiaceae bacterium]
MSDRSLSAPTDASQLTGDWVDAFLLAGDGDQVCLRMGDPVDRQDLRELVDQRQRELAEAGLVRGGTVSLRLPPSLAYVSFLLAAWRIGAQVSLLDHRLAPGEVERALGRLEPQVLVSAQKAATAPMAGYAREVDAIAGARPSGRPAATGHTLIQLSSGSTGPSKVIARTAADLTAELGRYRELAGSGYPVRGDRIVLLASIVHVLGLVGGLLHSLHAGVELVYPARLTADGITSAVAAGDAPTMVLGVPFHAELLCAGAAPPPLPQLARMVVAGELTRPGVPEAFTSRYGVPLGSMYGMTELGVIATDLSGSLRPAVAPAPGMTLRVDAGELMVKMAASPYVGLVDPTRWSDGWLRTRDAATMDPGTGLVTILGRLDSQVSIGGLKVDLTEVEQTICGLPQVSTAVVVYDKQIDAYLVLAEGCSLADAEAAMAGQLAAYKRPRQLTVLPELPRTATGKIVRDHAVLRAAAAQAGAATGPAAPG